MTASEVRLAGAAIWSIAAFASVIGVLRFRV